MKTPFLSSCAATFRRGAFLALALSLLLGLSAHAATQTVTTTADSGAGSLRDTLAAAAAGDTIVFDASLSAQTITLASQLTLAQNVTIDASALPGGLTLSGNNATRIILISDSTVTAVLNSLTIANGSVVGDPLSLPIAQGAGIYNAGALTLNQCTVRNCACAQDGVPPDFQDAGVVSQGGGIYNASTAVLSLVNSTIQSNSATGGLGSNGGVYEDGYPGGNGEGGGLYNAGTISVCSQSTFAGNSATAGKGGDQDGGSGANGSPAGKAGGAGGNGVGGGLCKTGTVTLASQCTFSGNSGMGGTGGLGGAAASSTSLPIDFGSPGGSGGNGGDGTGGGIYNAGAGTMSLRQCTFSSNSILGGPGGNGGIGYNGTPAGDTTGKGNGGQGGHGGDSGAGSGGGCYNAGAIPLFTQCTFSGNSASGNSGGTGSDGGAGDETQAPNQAIGQVGGAGGNGGRGGNGTGGQLYNGGTISLLSQSTFAGNSGNGGHGGNGGNGGVAGNAVGNISVPSYGGNGGAGGSGGKGVNGGTAGNGGAGGNGGFTRISGGTGGPGGNGGDGGAGGNASSSGIYSSGSLAMSGCILSGSTGSAGSGGTGGTAGAGGGFQSPAVAAGTAGNAGNAGNAGVAIGADSGSVITSQGHNLLRAFDPSGGTFNGAAGDIALSASVSLSSVLGSLANNGGPTATIALPPGSPAIDAGDDTITDTTDQRGTGFPRSVGAHVDIGAYEFNAVALGYTAPAVVSQSAGSVTITPATGLGSLTISASENANGLAATSYIQYGVGTGYGNATAPVSYGNGNSAVPVNLTLAGLSPGITWHYRVVTTTAAGTTYGADQTVAVGTPGDINGDGIVDLYSLAQVQALNVDAPLLQRDNTGTFTLTLGVQKSTDLVNFNAFPVTAPQITVDGQGRMQVQFTVPDNAAFFRIQAQ